MTPAQSAFVVLATFLGVTGFSLSVSASAFPPLPRFRIAKRRIAALAGISLAASLALVSWVLHA
jgi:hypothetical protein